MSEPEKPTVSRYERGHQLVGEVNGGNGQRIVDELGDLGRYIVEFAYGDVYDRPGLSLRDRALITVGALAAMRGCEPQLTVHLRSAMRVGLTPAELEEVLIHVAPYAGFPAAMNAMDLLKAILAEDATAD
jgi:4-carboxymuconolactone decarboxylase